MEDYYEILEVSKKASKEIIDKAYKTLAKKYHPDANPEEKKQWAEEKFKKINEAYEILSNKEKREEYDKQIEIEKRRVLIETENLKEKYKKLQEQNQILQNQLSNLNMVDNNNTYEVSNRREEINYNNLEAQINEKVTQTVNKAYYDAYIQSMRSYGYRITHKKTIRKRINDILACAIFLIIMITILLILWQIPAFRNYIQTNKIIQSFKNAFFK